MPKFVRIFIPILFAVYGLIVVLDYYLPYSEKTAEIESILKEDVERSGRRGRTKYSVYKIKIDGESIRTDAETYQKEDIAREAKIFRTKMLQEVIKIETKGIPLHIRSFPFFLFPILPILFVLPFVTFLFKSKHKFFDQFGIFSLIIACVLLAMSLT